MGNYCELLEKYNSLSDRDKKKIMEIFPQKEGKLLLPEQGKILIPTGKTLVIFISCFNGSSNSAIIDNFRKYDDCRIISFSETMKLYYNYDSSLKIINEIFEDDVISSLEDGYVTIIEEMCNSMLTRAILLKGFEKYYDNVIAITLDNPEECKGSLIYDIFNTINRLNEERKYKLRLGVDLNYIVSEYSNYLKVILKKEV